MSHPDLRAAIHDGRTRWHWRPLPVTDFEVMADALRVDGVRVPVTACAAQRADDEAGEEPPPRARLASPNPQTSQFQL